MIEDFFPRLIDALLTNEWNGARVGLLVLGIGTVIVWLVFTAERRYAPVEEEELMCLVCHALGGPQPGCCVEPTDAQLAASGVRIEPTDPFDQESYK